MNLVVPPYANYTVACSACMHDIYNNVYCMNRTLLSLPLSVGTRTSVMLTNLVKNKQINLVCKCEVMACNSLLQDRSKYLEAGLELLFRIRCLHFGAHHGNVVPLWGHIVGKRHTGYIDVWRCKSSITYAYVILLLCISQYGQYTCTYYTSLLAVPYNQEYIM